MNFKDLIKTYRSALKDAQDDQAVIDKAHTEYKPRIADLLAGGDGRPKVALDETAALIQDLDRALAAPSDSLARQVLAPWIHKTAPELVDLGQATRDPQPEQIIGYGKGSLLAAGEVLVLAGRGGAGKSTLACQLALEAATAPANGQGHTAGLTVASGNVVILSYEDRRWRVWHRVQRIAKALKKGQEATVWAMHSRIGVCEAAGWPLFGVEGGGHIGQAPQRLAVWRPLWDDIAARAPRLVVIDPVLAAFNGDDARVSAVRSFLDAVRQEAEPLGAGVILIAHTTKAARKPQDNSIDPGAVGGSAAWTDAARAALLLSREDDRDLWRLDSIKSNYSAPVKLSLCVQYQDDGLGGFELATADQDDESAATAANGDGYGGV